MPTSPPVCRVTASAGAARLVRRNKCRGLGGGVTEGDADHHAPVVRMPKWWRGTPSLLKPARASVVRSVVRRRGPRVP
ncbi:hypothetical protein NGM37_07355, partial [Streptomyces sp. TRM76130]|nr:hypothetical protein [Streptomyces sp. TRM76130]